MKKILLFLAFSLIQTASTFSQELSSGLPLGSNCPAFDPHHVSGPDKNSTACPMCKYGSRQGVMIWVNSDNWKALEPILMRMEKEVQSRGVRKFRAFVMFMNPGRKPLADAMKETSEQANRLKLKYVALTVIPHPEDKETAGLFEINPDSRIKNTVLVYKRRQVAYKSINLTEAGLDDLLKKCDELFAVDPI